MACHAVCRITPPLQRTDFRLFLVWPAQISALFILETPRRMLRAALCKQLSFEEILAKSSGDRGQHRDSSRVKLVHTKRKHSTRETMKQGQPIASLWTLSQRGQVSLLNYCSLTGKGEGKWKMLTVLQFVCHVFKYLAVDPAASPLRVTPLEWHSVVFTLLNVCSRKETATISTRVKWVIVFSTGPCSGL